MLLQRTCPCTLLLPPRTSPVKRKFTALPRLNIIDSTPTQLIIKKATATFRFNQGKTTPIQSQPSIAIEKINQVQSQVRRDIILLLCRQPDIPRPTTTGSAPQTPEFGKINSRIHQQSPSIKKSGYSPFDGKYPEIA